MGLTSPTVISPKAAAHYSTHIDSYLKTMETITARSTNKMSPEEAEKLTTISNVLFPHAVAQVGGLLSDEQRQRALAAGIPERSLRPIYQCVIECPAHGCQ